VKPNFRGRFTKGYAVNEKEYRETKYRDMVEADEKKKQPTIRHLNIVYARRLLDEGWSTTKIGKFFNVTPRTIRTWVYEEYDKEIGTPFSEEGNAGVTYTKLLTPKGGDNEPNKKQKISAS
jgi:hypothetical protein